MRGLLMTAFRCRACGDTSQPRRFTAREMMFGSRDSFEYQECAGCGSLQIAEIPPDLGRYYPAGYYAHQAQQPGSDPLPISWLKRQRAAYCLTGRGLVGRLAVRLLGRHYYYDWFRSAGIGLNDSVLDVGAGDGGLLLFMRREGFTRLLGIEPYAVEDVVYGNGVRVLKRRLQELDGKFDFIMFNHSFEHLADPLEALRQVKRLLSPGKPALVRVPVVPSYAWEQYGPDWVQLDAPRHLLVPSVAGMRSLAAQADLEVTGVEYDSDALQFWGSELYRRDIPLQERDQHPFPPEQMAGWSARAQELNREGRGDQACFYLR